MPPPITLKQQLKEKIVLSPQSLSQVPRGTGGQVLMGHPRLPSPRHTEDLQLPQGGGQEGLRPGVQGVARLPLPSLLLAGLLPEAAFPGPVSIGPKQSEGEEDWTSPSDGLL